MKKCNKCGEEKNFSDFYLEKGSKDGYRSKCKICFKEYAQQNKEKIKEYKNQYYSINEEILKNKKREYYLINKEILKSKRNDYYNLNKEKTKNKNKEYYLSNKSDINKYALKYRKQRINNDPKYKIISNIRNLVKISIIKNGYTKKSKTHEIIGCSFIEFQKYIELQFEPWMNWSNNGIYTGIYNETWQLDHIIPISFGKTEDEIIILNHYTNFQPLCSRKNLEKSNL